MTATTVLSFITLYFLGSLLLKCIEACRSDISVVRTDPDMALLLLGKRERMFDRENVYESGDDHFEWLKEAKTFLKYYQP